MFKVLGAFVMTVVSALLAAMVVSFDQDGNPQYPDWNAADLDVLLSAVKAADGGEGVQFHVIKQRMAGMGTNDLLKGLGQLQQQGKLTKRNVRVQGAKVAYATWFPA